MYGEIASSKRKEAHTGANSTGPNTYMAKVEDILIIDLVETKVDMEVALFQPLSERVEEAWFIIVQTEVILAFGGRQDVRIVAISSQILSIRKIHRSWTTQRLIAVTIAVWRWNAGLQLVDIVVSTIGKVGETQWMEVVLVLTLKESMSDANLQSKSWVHTVASLDFKVT